MKPNTLVQTTEHQVILPAWKVATVESDLSELEGAILQTLIYADLFDYPMNVSQIQRYLHGFHAEMETVQSALAGKALAAACQTLEDGGYCLAGRAGLAEVRRERSLITQQALPQADYYGRLIAKLPFVRMVALTGSLAMGNLAPGGDLDFMLVVENNRLWLCRLLVVLLSRLAKRRGVTICPNYIITRRNLTLPSQNLYSAHELAQMVPLSGMPVYHELRRSNSWCERYLPNAVGPPLLWPNIPAYHSAPDSHAHSEAAPSKPLKNFLEALLRLSVFDPLEKWEMKRKMRKFERRYGYSAEACFSPEQCKGHYDGHAQMTLERYTRRLESYGLTRERDQL